MEDEVYLVELLMLTPGRVDSLLTCSLYVNYWKSSSLKFFFYFNLFTLLIAFSTFLCVNVCVCKL